MTSWLTLATTRLACWQRAWPKTLRTRRKEERMVVRRMQLQRPRRRKRKMLTRLRRTRRKRQKEKEQGKMLPRMNSMRMKKRYRQ